MVFQQNIQLGMVRTFFVNPPELPKTVEKEWLAPKPLDNEGGAKKATIEIPAKWLGFF